MPDKDVEYLSINWTRTVARKSWKCRKCYAPGEPGTECFRPRNEATHLDVTKSSKLCVSCAQTK